MQKITVAQARQAEAVGKQVRLDGWVRKSQDRQKDGRDVGDYGLCYLFHCGFLTEEFAKFRLDLAEKRAN